MKQTNGTEATLALTTVATKLRPPRQLRQLLARGRLLDHIEQGLARRLVLVSAPAGYGKTSLLVQAQAMLSARGGKACWLSLDEHDNDAVRFVAHLGAATRQVGVALSPETESLLRASGDHGTGPSAGALQIALLNEFSRLDSDLYLILDDFHLIKERAVLELVSALLLAPLERLRLLIGARGQPALPMGRLRAQGEVAEISARMLAFSGAEAMRFMDGALGRRLSDIQVDQLCDKTEGWIASLQMAAIALQGGADTDSFLLQFSGADRSVADFLIEEVLQRQSPEIQEFLLATAILERFNADLCNAVLEHGDSVALMEQVEQLNLFIFSLDRDRNWYRYHKLFSDLLRQRLVQRFAARAATYHRRACAWLAGHGHGADAIEHAFAAGDTERAGELIDAISPALFASGQTEMLRRLAERLPLEIARELPRLQLELAWENTIRWRFDDARRALRAVTEQLARQAGRDPAVDEQIRIKLAHREFMVDLFTDRWDLALPAGTAWLRQCDTNDQFMRSSVRIAALMCQRDSYQCELAQPQADSLRAQLLEANAIFGMVFLDTVAGSIHYERGDLRLAEAAFVQARAGGIRIHGEDSALSAMPSAQLARLVYERNELAQARQLIDALEVSSAEFGLVDSVIARYVTGARLARADGDDLDAHRRLDQATHLADRYQLPRLHAHVLAERVRLLLSEGLQRDAERLLLDPRYAGSAEASQLTGQADSRGECLALAAARIALEGGDTHQAAKSLRRWMNWTRDRGCLRPAIRFALLLAIVCQRAGDALAARRALLDALRWGADGGFMRSFLDEGPVMADMLAQLAGSAGGADVFSADYLERLLAAFGRPQQGLAQAAPLVAAAQVADDPRGLGERELEILRLSAANLDTREIAEALGLAESTVKWYWKRIFERLGVRRRALAVRAARLRGLIV
ncbi:MAG: LuxR C-terminal-related transcriptional regulator [Pseudomonadota bacterium]